MTTITLADAQARLVEIVGHLQPGEEIVIVHDEHPVAKLIASNGAVTKRSEPGFMKGSVLYMAPDFDALLDDFKEW